MVLTNKVLAWLSHLISTSAIILITSKGIITRLSIILAGISRGIIFLSISKEGSSITKRAVRLLIFIVINFKAGNQVILPPKASTTLRAETYSRSFSITEGATVSRGLLSNSIFISEDWAKTEEARNNIVNKTVIKIMQNIFFI